MTNLDVKIIDYDGKDIGFTTMENAKKIVKLKRGVFTSDNTICLKINNLKKVKIKKENKHLSKIGIPKYTLSEELLNAISHGFGSLLSIAMAILCIVFSAFHHNTYAIISTSIYGAMSIILFTMSTLYHSFKINNAKRVFRIIDHCSIYLLIAGTYTPYALVTLREASYSLGWTVFGVIWGCAALGITFTAIDMNKFKVPGMILYLIMGWMIIFTFKTLMKNLDMMGIYLMLAAGAFYTIGSILYGLGKKVKYMHSIFHIFVVVAAILFFFSIFFYVI